MLRGFYISANNIINQERALNVTTNNIANSSTAGYKRELSMPTTFEERLLLLRSRKNETGTIQYRTQAYTWTDTEQGTFEYTYKPLDLALRGNVFFNIEGRVSGERWLTRDGQFAIDGEGYLSLGTAGRILDANGQPIPLGTSDFEVSERGVITTEDGRTFTLGLTYVDEYTDMERYGDNMFRPYDGAQIGNIPDDAEYRVIQGAYERSNVDLGEEMVDAMAYQRNFEASAQALQIMNSVNSIVANDLMKI